METRKCCIICCELKPTTDFNIEHIFPAALGGVIETENVCSFCNALLNQKVDEPFVKSNFVLYYRHVFQLNRDSKRGISKIIKDPIEDSEGNKRLVKFENGKLKGELIDQFDYKILPNGKVECKLTIDSSKISIQDEIIKKNIERLSKRLELDLGTSYIIGNIETKTVAPSDVTVNASNDMLVNVSLKIAYELACSLNMDYVSDPCAKKILNFLMSENIEPEVKEHINRTGINKFEVYHKRFEILGLPIHQHAFLLDNVDGEGVFGIVKIFNYIYPILLSKNNDLFLRQDFLIINDVLEKVFFTNYTLNYQLITIELELNNVPKIISDNIKLKGLHCFDIINNSFCIYNNLDKMVFPDINALCHYIIENKEFDVVNLSNLKLDLKEQNNYIKTIDGFLIKILSLIVTQRIVVHELPKG